MTLPPSGRIAIVHDYLTQRGGAERLVGEMARLLPDADVHASVVDPDQVPDSLRATRIRTTPLQHVFARGVPLTALAPLMPTAFGRMRLDDAEIVLSSTTAFAHHVRARATSRTATRRRTSCGRPTSTSAGGRSADGWQPRHSRSPGARTRRPPAGSTRTSRTLGTRRHGSARSTTAMPS